MILDTRQRMRALFLGTVIFAVWAVFGLNEANAGTIIQRPLYIGLTNGLVGYWSFDAPDMAGVAAYDRSGNNNTGTLTNGPVRAIGKIGQALNFDGVNDYILVPYIASFAFTNKVTVAAWLYLPKGWSSANSVAGMIIKDQDNTSGFSLYMNSGNGKAGFWIYDTTWRTTATAKDSWTAGWYHLVGVYNGSNVQLYLNSVPNGTPTAATGNITNKTLNASIGYSFYESLYPFHGLIDDVRIYNRALAPDEIKRLYNMGATTKFNVSKKQDPSFNQGLVGLWTFDGNDMSGNTAIDRSGQGNNGMLTNGPTRQIGKIGQALSFDGVNDYAVLANGLASNLSGGKTTISAWVYAWSRPQWATIIKNWGQNIAGAFHFGLESTSGDLSLYVTQSNGTSAGPTREGSGTPLPLGSWQHVTAVADGTQIKLYRNGVSVGTPVDYNGTFKTSFLYTNIAVKPGDTGGTDGGGTPGFWNGLIDDVRIYNRALSPDEIKRLYNMGATTKFNVSKKQDPSLNQGLVGLWTFDAPDMAGVAAYDRSGNNNTGTLTNGPARAVGKIGQALSFDGADDYTLVASPSNLPTGDFTLSAWIKLNSNNVYQATVSIGKTAGIAPERAERNELLLDVNPSNNLEVWTRDTVRATSNGSISIGTWTHIAASRSGSNIKLYINGINDGSGTDGTAISLSCNIYIGIDPYVSAGFGGCPTVLEKFTNGSIDDVRIYNRALSPDEIKRLYNMGR